MGRSPCCSKIGLNRGSWTASEDKILSDYIKLHGEGKWRQLPIKAGLKRCGKSCRLRWLNYLKPDIKRGNISCDEEDLIIRLHKLLGNRWSLIAGRLPGRTDNEIKNYWNTTLAKKVQDLHHHTSHDHMIHPPPESDQSQEHDYFRKRKNKECVVNESNVVRTKAVRCSTTHFSPHPQPQQLHPPRSNIIEIKDPVNFPQPVQPPAAFPFYHENNSNSNVKKNNVNLSSFNFDVNMGEGCSSLAGLFDMDFSDTLNLNDQMVKGDDMMSNSSTITAAIATATATNSFVECAGTSTATTDATPPGFSKEIMDYFNTIPEMGGEWLSSL